MGPLKSLGAPGKYPLLPSPLAGPGYNLQFLNFTQLYSFIALYSIETMIRLHEHERSVERFSCNCMKSSSEVSHACLIHRVDRQSKQKGWRSAMEMFTFVGRCRQFNYEQLMDRAILLTWKSLELCCFECWTGKRSFIVRRASACWDVNWSTQFLWCSRRCSWYLHRISLNTLL